VIVHLEVRAFEVAHPLRDLATWHREGIGPPPSGRTDGAGVVAEQLEHLRLVRADDQEAAEADADGGDRKDVEDDHDCRRASDDEHDERRDGEQLESDQDQESDQTRCDER